MSLSARIVDFMSPHPVTIAHREPVGRAREIFIEQGFTILPIVDDDGHLCGIVSATDLGGVDENEDVDDRPISDVMIEQVITAASTASVTDAAVSLAAHRIHHVVVVDLANRPVGVLSTLDIANAMVDADLSENVSTLMTKEVMTVDAGTAVGEALDLLDDSSVSAAVVLDANDYVGVLSRLSLLRAEADDRVDQVMERDIVHADADDSVSEVAAAFAETSVRRMLVIDGNGAVVGIVTPTDLIRYAAGLAEYDGPGSRDDYDALADEEIEIVPYEPDDRDDDEDEF